ncbi:MAG: GntR family transcriptional regulator [Pseudomonadota bacterium]|nr:GntR family transcriptional regulator [Pseudomonadota bacterium]
MENAGSNRPDVPAIEIPPPLPVFVAERLADDIEALVYAPGERLSEEAIAQRFGVSRAPVREALRLLAQEEIVLIEPRRGARVRSYTPEEASEMFEMRAVLYGLGVQLFAERATADEMDAYIRIADRVAVVAAEPDVTPERFAAATQAASRFMLAHCGNARLNATMRKMTRRSFRHYAALAHGTPERRLETQVHGQAMREAILARRAREAGDIARSIVERNHREVMRRLALDGAPA